MTSYRNDAANTLGNARFLCDHKVFNISSLGNMSVQIMKFLAKVNKKDLRSTTEFNAGLPPFRIFNVLGNLINIELECHHPYGIWV